MKKTKIIYWIFTVLVAGLLGVGAIFNALSTPESVEHITGIGYPAYIVPFLGIAKLAGIIAILIPGFPRLKEWAYAGLAYDLVGALFSHIAFGNPPSVWGGLVVGCLLIAGSYFFYHKKVKEESEMKK